MFSSTAAVTAAATPLPAPSSEAAANWAEPAKVVADMSSAGSVPKPAEVARTPKVRPSNRLAMASGATRRAPSA